MTPVVFLLAALGVGISNTLNPTVVWYLPFDRVWPEMAGDIRLQGQYTVVTFALLGALTFARAWFSRNPHPLE